MKIYFEIRHPAHFHHFIPTIRELVKKGHEIKVGVSYKDVLVDLVAQENLDFQIIGKNTVGIKSKLKELVKQNKKVYKLCREFKPDLMVGRPSQTVTLNARLLSIPSIIFAEDDLLAVFYNGMLAYPFANIVLAPYVTKLGCFEYKKIGYAGYQKLAYLHPNRFKPDSKYIEKYLDISQPFFILRFSSLTAGHDINASGLTKELSIKIINKLKKHGNIYITSEKKLDYNLEKYRINVPVDKIHHALHFAKMFISDSQTMTMESALLGTPSLRYSSFVGKLSYLEELEHKYNLTFGYKINQSKQMITKVSELLNVNNLDNIWKIRLKKLLKDKIDVTAFMIWFIEDYPESVNIMRNNPEYQYDFR